MAEPVIKSEYAWMPMSIITPAPQFLCHNDDCERYAVARHADCMMAYCAECAHDHDSVGWAARLFMKAVDDG